MSTFNIKTVYYLGKAVQRINHAAHDAAMDCIGEQVQDDIA